MAGVPLSERVPLVDKSGFATPYLVRYMQDLGGGVLLPPQSGNAGKVLSTNGSVLEWIAGGGGGGPGPPGPAGPMGATGPAGPAGADGSDAPQAIAWVI